MQSKWNTLRDRLRDYFRFRRYFVIADAQDNSVTFSKALYHHIKRRGLGEAKVFVFSFMEKGRRYYGFTLNPTLDEPTQLADIQYNDKHRCIGFESLCPTVNRIFYDYGLPNDTRVKLSVSVRRIKTADSPPFTHYYSIRRPNYAL